MRSDAGTFAQTVTDGFQNFSEFVSFGVIIFCTLDLPSEAKQI